MKTKNDHENFDIVKAVKYYKNFVDTYKDDDFIFDRIFIEDMLYGIGVSIDEDKYAWAPGYLEFLKYLKNFIGERIKRHENKKINAKKLFYKFLKEEGIWYLYWYNVSLGQKNKWYCTKIIHPELYIFQAFSWMEAEFNLSDYKNKRGFWDNIDKKWRKYYEENSI